MAKRLRTRIQNKMDSEANWNTHSSFIPLEGEFIIYEVDSTHTQPRIKIGDGVTSVTNLPFASASGGSGDLENAGGIAIPLPYSGGALTYNKQEQSPIWNNYDSSLMTISGDTAKTDAGTYTTYFTPKSGYCWSDGTSGARAVTWEITKAKPNVTLSKTSVNVFVGSTSTVDIQTSDAIGTITVDSNNSTIATGTVSGKVITVSGKSQASTSLVIRIAESTNFLSTTLTLNVTVEKLKTLNECTWAEISAIAASGSAASTFSVGDTKSITLSGTIGALSVNTTLNVYIIGFNHYNSTNTIDFGTFKSGATDVALIDAKYNSTCSNSTTNFVLTSTSTASGGWKSSVGRYNILGSTNTSGGDATSTTATSPVSNSFMSALPSDLRAVMKPMTIYTANGGTAESNVTATVDYLPLLAEFEVRGTRSYAVTYEQNYQAQYTYYANGNSKIKYRHSSTTSTCSWWLRSQGSSYRYFVYTNTSGNSANRYGYYSHGLAPIFRV